MSETIEKLPGEGDVVFVKRTRARIECANCGEPASYRNTYLMPRARINPASAAYQKDDCSWCSDYDEFLCGDCHQRNVQVAVPSGYGECATFGIGTRFAHMFLTWTEQEVKP